MLKQNNDREGTVRLEGWTMLKNLFLNRPKSILNNHSNPIKQKEKSNPAEKFNFGAYEPEHGATIRSNYDMVECKDLTVAGDAKIGQITMKTPWWGERNVYLQGKAHVDKIKENVEHDGSIVEDYASCNVRLKENASADFIQANAYLSNYSSVNKIQNARSAELINSARANDIEDSNTVELRDDARAGNIKHAKTVKLSGTAKVDVIKGYPTVIHNDGDIELLDRAEANSVRAWKVQLRNNAKIHKEASTWEAELSDDSSVGEVSAKTELTLKDRAKARIVRADKLNLKNNAEIQDKAQVRDYGYLSDNSSVNNISGNSLHLSEKARAGNITAKAGNSFDYLTTIYGGISLENSATAQNINTEDIFVSLSDSAEADQISSNFTKKADYHDTGAWKPGVIISDYAKVGNINCSGFSNQVKLSGPVKVLGKIKFDDSVEGGGYVIVERNHGVLPVLDFSQIEGGKISGKEIKVRHLNLNGEKGYKNIEVLDEAKISGNTKVEELNAGGNVEIHDDSKVKSLISNGNLVDLTHSAQVDSITAKGEVCLHDEAEAGQITASDKPVILYNKSKAGSITAIGDVAIYDNASASDIITSGDVKVLQNSSVNNINLNNQTRPQTITITAPATIKGKVNFEKQPGQVIIRKDEAGELPNITREQITGGELVIGDLGQPFTPLIKEVQEANPQLRKLSELGQYSDFDSAIATYKGKDKQAISSLTDLDSDKHNRARQVYNEFAESTLKPLADAGKSGKEFSQHWVKNKEVAGQNLTDLWLATLGEKRIEQKTPEQKQEIINQLSSIPTMKQQLIAKTVDTCLRKIMPAAIRTGPANDFAEIEKPAKRAQFALKYTQKAFDDNRQKYLTGILSDRNIAKLENARLGDKRLVDIWLDAAYGDGSAAELQHIEDRKEALKVTAQDPDLAKKVLEQTIAVAEKSSEHIRKAKAAYQTVINTSDLDSDSKQLLTDYQNSQLFLNIVFARTPEQKRQLPFFLSSSTREILKDLTAERNEARKEFKETVIEPLRDTENIYYSDNEEDKLKLGVVFGLLSNRANFGNEQETKEATEKLDKFAKTCKGSDPRQISSQWNGLLELAQKEFEKAPLQSLTHSRIQDISFVNETLRGKELNQPVRNALSDGNLSVEQKAFVSRYSKDKNMELLVKKLNEGTIDKEEAIDESIGIESLNLNLFDASSQEFRNNITQESVGTNGYMADLYLKNLGHNPVNMKPQDKYQTLSRLHPQELELVSAKVRKDFVNTDLSGFMSNNFLRKTQKYNADRLAHELLQELKLTNASIQDQHATLLDLSVNFGKYAKKFEESQELMSLKTDKIIEVLGGIKDDTGNIRANVKILMAEAVRNAKNKELQKDLISMAEEIDREGVENYVKHAKSIENTKRRNTAIAISALAISAAAGVYLYDPNLYAMAGKEILKYATIVNKAGIQKVIGTVSPLVIKGVASKYLPFNNFGEIHKAVCSIPINNC